MVVYSIRIFLHARDTTASNVELSHGLFQHGDNSKSFHIFILFKPLMMKKFLPIIFFMLFGSIYSQVSTDTIKKNKFNFKNDNYLDLSVGLGDNVVVNSFQWDKLFAIAQNRIKIGFGLRINMANYWNKSFYTAPPQRVNNTLDTLTLDHQTIYFMNLHFVCDVVLLKWWDVGMNIDLVGASWGPTGEASYYSASNGYIGTRETVSPETLNLMLFGHNDHGNLNSQFYVRFWPSANVSIKAGMGLSTFITHTTNPLANGNTRFNAGSYTGFLSLGWTFGRSDWRPVSSWKKRNPGF